MPWRRSTPARPGKDVYVEKPPSHNCWEGRKMVEAARKYNRIVQVGTQNRSAAVRHGGAAVHRRREARQGPLLPDLQSEGMGQFPACSPTAIRPTGFDWDRWNGPAPAAAYNPTLSQQLASFLALLERRHHQRRDPPDRPRAVGAWVWSTRSASTRGPRYEKGARTPDTQIATYEFDDMIVTFELTRLRPTCSRSRPSSAWPPTSIPYWPQCATRIEIYGTEGLMYLGRHGGGWQVFTRPGLQEGVVKDQLKGLFPDPEHKENFLQCVRSRSANADIEEGHRSYSRHIPTISYRLGGQKVAVNRQTEQIVDNPEAMKLFKREYRKPYEIPEVV